MVVLQPILFLVAALLIAGVLVWAIDQLPAIDPTFKQVAKVLIIVALAIFAIVTVFGLFGVTIPIKP